MTGSYSFNPRTFLLNEPGINNSPQDIAAMAASGDSFITLANDLEEIIRLLPADTVKTVAELERVSEILLYMQRHYKVAPKAPDHRAGIY